MTSKYDEVIEKMRTALIDLDAIEPVSTDIGPLMDEVDDTISKILIAKLLLDPPLDYKKGPQKALFAKYFKYDEVDGTIWLNKTAAVDSFAPSISVPSGATRELSMSKVTRGATAKVAAKKASPKKKTAKKGTISKGTSSKVAAGKKATKKVASKKVASKKGTKRKGTKHVASKASKSRKKKA